jgi:hypothetical protein
LKLVGHPSPASHEDYLRAADELEGRLAALPGLVAIYRLGEVSAPGISDVDSVAVVDGAGPVPAIWPQLTETTRALAMHPPFLVDPSTFESHRLISHLEPMELAAGADIALEERPDPDYVERVLGAESIVLSLVRLLKYRSTGRIKVRAVLCELHTVRHGLSLAGLDRSEAAAAWRLADEVASLRGAWFALPPGRRDERLRQVVLDALPALISALDALAARSPRGDGHSDGRLALGGAWTGITLRGIGGSPTPSPRPGTRLTGAIASVSPKAAEGAWRLLLRRREVVVPARLIALLAECPSEHAEVCIRRADLLARHREFMAERGRGYASIAISPFLRAA